MSIKTPTKKKKKRTIKIRFKRPGIDLRIELIESLIPLFFVIILKGLKILTDLIILNFSKTLPCTPETLTNQKTTIIKSKKFHPSLKYDFLPLKMRPLDIIFITHSKANIEENI